MTRILNFMFYVMLVAVVASTWRSVAIGLTDRAQYLAVFRHADGPLYAATIATSFAAGANAILLAFKQRWAIWTNAAIGVWSIILLQIVGAPPVNQAIVLVACGTTTLLPLLLWRKTAPAA